MDITTRTARIETTKPNGNEQSAFIDVSSAIMGFAATLRFSPGMCGHFVLATRSDDNKHTVFLVALPSERWLDDLRDDGYTVIQTITAPDSQPE